VKIHERKDTMAAFCLEKKRFRSTQTKSSMVIRLGCARNGYCRIGRRLVERRTGSHMSEQPILHQQARGQFRLG
jgi:hypothetical protein